MATLKELTTPTVNITIPDGRKKYVINNDERRAFYSNLTDDEMKYRASVVPSVLEKYAKELQEKLSKGEVDEIESLHLLDEKAKEQVDFVFDSDVSRAVFGNLSASAIGNRKTGDTLLEIFFEAMFPHLEKEMREAAENLKDAEKRILKYTKKYTKE